MENYVDPAFPYVSCYMTKKSTIFSYPRVTFHTVSIYSVHYYTTYDQEVVNLHAKAALGWETNEISTTPDSTYGGFTARDVHMDTEFYYERCILDGFIEFERRRHTERSC